MDVYENLSSSKLGDDVKISVVLREAPQKLRHHLLMNSQQIESNYNKLRAIIQAYLNKNKTWIPNDFRETEKQEQEQRQQERKQQRRQQRQQQGQEQRQEQRPQPRQGKSKRNSKRKGSGKPHNDKECYVCGKKGHFARDCWSRANHDKMVNEFEVKNVNAGANVKPLQENGKRQICLRICGQTERYDFHVVNVTKPILSVICLCEHGVETHLAEKSFLRFGDGHEPLIRKGGVYFVKAQTVNAVEDMTRDKSQERCVRADGSEKSRVQDDGLTNSWVQADGLKNSWVPADGLQKSWVQADGLKNSCVQADGLQNSCVQADGLQNSYVQADGLQNSWVQADGLKSHGYKLTD